MKKQVAALSKMFSLSLNATGITVAFSFPFVYFQGQDIILSLIL